MLSEKKLEKIKNDFLKFFDENNLPTYQFGMYFNIWIGAYKFYTQNSINPKYTEDRMKAKKPAKKPVKKPVKK
jgi:hypothetical protein